MIKMYKSGIKILIVLTVTLLMAGCNGGGGSSSSGITTSDISSTTEVPNNISEDLIIPTEASAEDFNNQSPIEQLNIPAVTTYIVEAQNTDELSTEVYTDITEETTAPAANPEPATLALLGIGLLGLIGFKRKKVK